MQGAIFIIAEAGVNHNCKMEIAKKMIDEAVKAGADAVKFQTWKTEVLCVRNSELAKYQQENSPSFSTQFDLLKRLELPYNAFIELKRYCDRKGIIFMSTPDEIESADFLYNLQDIFKIGSGELTNIPFLRHVGAFGKKIFLSTGMATLQEIDIAIKTLINAGTEKKNITALHCVTDYPASFEDVNLRAMNTIAKTFNVNVGYSDHTQGIETAIAAAALGAKVIEKHFTLDKNMDGPDHKASIDVNELTAMIKAIRNVEKALGKNIKTPSESELKNKEVVRKRIVAKTYIAAGTLFTENNLITKRASRGIPALYWDEVIGKKASQDYLPDQPIETFDYQDSCHELRTPALTEKKKIEI